MSNDPRKVAINIRDEPPRAHFVPVVAGVQVKDLRKLQPDSWPGREPESIAL